MTFSKYKELYINFLPIVLATTSFTGLFTGVHANAKYASKPIDIFSNILGYTSIGVTSGVLYPISFPLFGSYILYKNYTSK
jgi:hypothetical protein